MATLKATPFRGWITAETETEIKQLIGQERRRRNAEIRLATFGKENFFGSKIEFPPGTVVARHYQIIKRCKVIGKRTTRSFVYFCNYENKVVALKIARRVSDDPSIGDQTYLTVYRELLVWKELEKFLPTMFYFNPPINDLKLDPRGISYKALSFNFDHLMQRFAVLPIGLCLLAAADTLCAIKQLHDCGYVHRDIHPRHFCLGLADGGTMPNIVYLIDLSHAERFVFYDPSVEIPTVEFYPDPIYSSTDAIEGKQYTRRDDLLSWIYSILAFRQCHFWRKYGREQRSQIKDELSEDRLVVGFGPAVGPCLAAMFYYLRQLNPVKKPDYGFLMQCIVTALKAYCNNNVPPSLPEKLTHFWKLDKYKATMSDEEAFASRYKIITQDSCYGYRDEAPEKVSSVTMQNRINGWFDQLTKDSHLKMFTLIESRMKIPEEFPSVLDLSDKENTATTEATKEEEEAIPCDEEDKLLPPKKAKKPHDPSKPKKEKTVEERIMLVVEDNPRPPPPVAHHPPASPHHGSKAQHHQQQPVAGTLQLQSAKKVKDKKHKKERTREEDLSKDAPKKAGSKPPSSAKKHGKKDKKDRTRED